MNFFLKKSEISLKAAKLLNENDNELANSSIHCSYYSCVQMMLHILTVIFGENSTSLRNISKNNNEGSHEVMINLLSQHLRNKRENVRDFNNAINQLKIFRKKADYEEVIISKEESREVYKLASKVRDNLKISFSVI